MLLLLSLACAPAFRMPGPLAGLGREPVESWSVTPRAAPLPSEPAEAPRRTSPSAASVAAAASGFLGARSLQVDGDRYRWDCSGLVEASLASAGCAFKGSSADLFDQARKLHVLHRRHLPTPGDIAFFDDTYDRNGNGRLDDPLSHVAVVEKVEADGTITLVHVGSRGVVRFVMNLRHPEDRADADGKRINDYLRARGKSDSPRTRYLSGELWVGFASFWEPRAADQVATAERSTR